MAFRSAARAGLVVLGALAQGCWPATPPPEATGIHGAAAPASSASQPASPAPAPSTSAASADARYASLWDRFLDAYLRLRPVDATTLGRHDHDGEWPDL